MSESCWDTGWDQQQGAMRLSSISRALSEACFVPAPNDMVDQSRSAAAMHPGSAAILGRMRAGRPCSQGTTSVFGILQKYFIKFDHPFLVNRHLQ